MERFRPQIESAVGDRLEFIQGNMFQFVLHEKFFDNYEETIEFENLLTSIFNNTGKKTRTQFYIKPPKSLRPDRKSFCKVYL